MSTIRSLSALATAILLLAFTAYAQQTAVPAAPPDANLYTNYSFSTGYQNVNWIVCGSTQSTSGCYDFGSMGPFGKAGALIEGNQAVNTTTNTVTRLIFVVDIAAGSSGTDTILYVYKKTDVITSTFDTVTVTLLRSVPLTLIGGSTAICSLAANNGFLFIGTDQTPFAVRVQKSNMAVTQVGGFSPPINVTSITSDKYGFVTVTFGGSFNGGFYAFGPTGSLVEDGGGSDFMLSTTAGLTTTNLPQSGAFPAGRMLVHAKE